MCLLILPGNKYLVMGTKEGALCLYDLNQGQSCQIVDSAHKKEIYELAMHTAPQIKNSKGQLLIASASADQSIKFWNLAESSSTGKRKL